MGILYENQLQWLIQMMSSGSSIGSHSGMSYSVSPFDGE